MDRKRLIEDVGCSYGGNEEKRKVRLVAWDTVLSTIGNGGLNIRGCRI